MRALLLAILIALVSPLQLNANELQPFVASYTTDWSQVAIRGKAQRSLQVDENGDWLLSFNASMLVASITESSRFQLNDGQLQPLSYYYNRSAMGKAKISQQKFNWQDLTASGKDHKGREFKIPLQTAALDKSSYQLALQLDVANGKQEMQYRVLDGKSFDNYEFRVTGQELVSTSLGDINAIKVERVREASHNQRHTTLWFAPEWNYLLVRLLQVERDGKEYNIVLKDASINGQQLSQ